MKMKSYYQKEIETASREEILKIQNEKIKAGGHPECR